MATPIDLSEITALHWQPALGQEGAVVTGLADVAQCLRTILTTPTRSVPHRPEFGSDYWSHLDRPLTVALPQIIAASWAAVERWEPRVRLIDIRPLTLPTSDSAAGRLRLQVTWALAIDPDGASHELTVAL